MSGLVLSPEAEAAEGALRASWASLRAAARALREAADPVAAGTATRALSREADHCGAAALRLVTMLGKLPRVAAPKAEISEDADAGLLGIATTILAQLRRIAASPKDAICASCGGFLSI